MEIGIIIIAFGIGWGLGANVILWLCKRQAKKLGFDLLNDEPKQEIEGKTC